MPHLTFVIGVNATGKSYFIQQKYADKGCVTGCCKPEAGIRVLQQPFVCAVVFMVLYQERPVIFCFR